MQTDLPVDDVYLMGAMNFPCLDGEGKLQKIVAARSKFH
jgi:hypothetical protein